MLVFFFLFSVDKRPRLDGGALYSVHDQCGQHLAGIAREIASAQRTGEIDSAQCTGEIASAQRTGEIASAQRTGEIASAQRTGEIASAQRTVKRAENVDSESTEHVETCQFRLSGPGGVGWTGIAEDLFSSNSKKNL
nr:hypothetical protein BgiMline_019205 [Biomphalaria glabrata]